MPAPDAAPPQPPQPPQASWLAALQDLARELPGLVTDRLDLLGLELRRAGLPWAGALLLVLLLNL
ncbi:MAG: hypothetical protein KGL50_02635, partial [Burkholderiales bacterium]|nr:hypothetical protein [Burkholderiales bacterium]